MENFAVLVIPALMGVILLRLMLLPISWVCRLALHSGCGFICLWLLNLASGATGILLPINGLTVLAAGFGGIPGIGLVGLLELL